MGSKGRTLALVLGIPWARAFLDGVLGAGDRGHSQAHVQRVEIRLMWQNSAGQCIAYMLVTVTLARNHIYIFLELRDRRSVWPLSSTLASVRSGCGKLSLRLADYQAEDCKFWSKTM